MGKLIVFLVIMAVIVGAMVYFAGQAGKNGPKQEEKRIEIDNVIR